MYFELTDFPTQVGSKLVSVKIENPTNDESVALITMMSFFAFIWIVAFIWTTYVKYQHRKMAKQVQMELKTEQKDKSILEESMMKDEQVDNNY